MRLPRDLSGEGLSERLRSFGYEVTRQTGSHLRLTTQVEGEHHVTVPKHSPLRVGTLAAIVSEVVHHLNRSREDVIRALTN